MPLTPKTREGNLWVKGQSEEQKVSQGKVRSVRASHQGI